MELKRGVQQKASVAMATELAHPAKKVTEVKEAHNLNAYGPMEETLAGREILVRPD